MGERVVMSYSGGKDSSLALHVLCQNSNWEVVRLLTTGTKEYQRSSMHGVRAELLERQAEAIGLPLDIVWMDAQGGAAGYESSMGHMLTEYQKNGIEHVAFGDLYLEDVRAYREKMNDSVGMKSVFPVWDIPTKEFALQFIQSGFKAIVVCVDTTQLDASFCGREYDETFLADLPQSVDWCAERGEFHTFCYAGPIFKEPIRFTTGERVLRDERFQYVDLIPD